MLEPIPFAGMVEIDLPAKTYTNGKPNYIMNNEPVAWMLLRDESCVETTEWYGVMRGWEEFLGDNEKIVELYTHPAKTLTDEEIIKVYQSLWKFLPAEEPCLAKDIKDFARAILRKAQEK